MAVSTFSLGCERAPTSNQAAQKPAHKSIPTAEILATLSSADAAVADRLESIHKARNAQLKQAIAPLRELLGSQNPDIIVAAAAALAGLDAAEADLAVIQAAGRLSRARRFEYLRRILYILGSIGGPRARTYLETIAQAHEVAFIRMSATEILNEMDAI